MLELLNFLGQNTNSHMYQTYTLNLNGATLKTSQSGKAEKTIQTEDPHPSPQPEGLQAPSPRQLLSVAPSPSQIFP